MKAELFIQQLGSKPNKALFYLYRKRKSVVSWILKNSGNKEDAEDAMQEALCILYDNLIHKNQKLYTSPEQYFLGICKNLWWTRLRQIKKETNHRVNINTGYQESENETYETTFLDLEAQPILDELGDKCQKLLQYFYYERLSIQLIAEKLNFRNEKVAKAMKYKCLEKARLLVFKNKEDERD